MIQRDCQSNDESERQSDLYPHSHTHSPKARYQDESHR